MTISLKAQKNTDTLLTQSDSCKVSFLKGNLKIRMLSYTFEDYLNSQEPFIIRSRNGHHPLFVIDGEISNQDTLGLNVTDIKSITVHKDGSTMKLNGAYLAKGKNGVIIVTTKRGQTKVQRYLPPYQMMSDNKVQLFPAFFKKSRTGVTVFALKEIL